MVSVFGLTLFAPKLFPGQKFFVQKIRSQTFDQNNFRPKKFLHKFSVKEIFGHKFAPKIIFELTISIQ